MEPRGRNQSRRDRFRKDSQGKARQRSKSEEPHKAARRLVEMGQDSSEKRNPEKSPVGPQWAVMHEPQQSCRPFCLQQFSDDNVSKPMQQSGSDTDSGDSDPKSWTRNPLLIRKSKKAERTKNEWRKPLPVNKNNEKKNSQTIPIIGKRNNYNGMLLSSSADTSKIAQSTWSNPDRQNPLRSKYQRFEEIRKQRIDTYPTSDEESNAHSEISQQMRQRLLQVANRQGHKSGDSNLSQNKIILHSSTFVKNIEENNARTEPNIRSNASKYPQVKDSNSHSSASCKSEKREMTKVKPSINNNNQFQATENDILNIKMTSNSAITETESTTKKASNVSKPVTQTTTVTSSISILPTKRIFTNTYPPKTLNQTMKVPMGHVLKYPSEARHEVSTYKLKLSETDLDKKQKIEPEKQVSQKEKPLNTMATSNSQPSVNRIYSDGDSLDELLESNMKYLKPNGPKQKKPASEKSNVISEVKVLPSKSLNEKPSQSLFLPVTTSFQTSTEEQPCTTSKVLEIIPAISKIKTSEKQSTSEIELKTDQHMSKPIITISESLLVADNAKNLQSSKLKPFQYLPQNNHLNSHETMSAQVKSESHTGNNADKDNLSLLMPKPDVGMFSDVEYDIEVTERVKKWEQFMKKKKSVSAPSIQTDPLAAIEESAECIPNVKELTNEWSKYLALIEEEIARKPHSSDEVDVNISKSFKNKHYTDVNLKNVSKSLLLSPSEQGSVSDGDLYKQSLYSLDQSRNLMPALPQVNKNDENIIQQSYNDGQAAQFSNSDVYFSKPTTESQISSLGRLQRKNRPQMLSRNSFTGSSLSDSGLNNEFSDMRPPNTSFTSGTSPFKNEHSHKLYANSKAQQPVQSIGWLNIINNINDKFKETEIWSPQLDSHQGLVSIERVTARTLETIPFSKDPFWKEIEDLTNFEKTFPGYQSKPKDPLPAIQNFSKQSIPSYLTGLPPQTQEKLSFDPGLSTSSTEMRLLSQPPYLESPKVSVKATNKSDGFNALDEVLQDLQPLLHNKPISPMEYAKSKEMEQSGLSQRPLSCHLPRYYNEMPWHQYSSQCSLYPESESKSHRSMSDNASSIHSEFSNLHEFSNIQQFSQPNINYQSMTNLGLGGKQYHNVVNGNYQLDAMLLKEKLLGTGLVEHVEQSPSTEFSTIQRSPSSSEKLFKDVNNIVNETEPSIEELKVLAKQVEDKLSEIKSKILTADEQNLDKILLTLKKFSPRASAIISADFKPEYERTSQNTNVRKAKLNGALCELEKIYEKLNLNNEVYLEHAKSCEFPKSLSNEECVTKNLTSSMSNFSDPSRQDSLVNKFQLESYAHHPAERELNEYGKPTTDNAMVQIPVKDTDGGYRPTKTAHTSGKSSTHKFKLEDMSVTVVQTNSDAPTRRSRSRRQHRRATDGTSNEDSSHRKLRSKSAARIDNKSNYSVSFSADSKENLQQRSRSSARLQGRHNSEKEFPTNDDTRNSGPDRPKPPPRSSSLHRKQGRDADRHRRKSIPPALETKRNAETQTNDDEKRETPSKQASQQRLKHEFSCSSDSSVENKQPRKRAVAKGIAKMVDLFSSSDEERQRRAQLQSNSEINEQNGECMEKISDDSRTSKSSGKIASPKAVTPRFVKQRHEAKARQRATEQHYSISSQDSDAQLKYDDHNVTGSEETSTTINKPPLPLRQQWSESSEKVLSTAEDDFDNEISPENKDICKSPKQNQNRWSICSPRELQVNTGFLTSEIAKTDGTERRQSFHDLLASFEPDSKRSERFKLLKKSVSDEVMTFDITLNDNFHSEPDLRQKKADVKHKDFESVATKKKVDKLQ